MTRLRLGTWNLLHGLRMIPGPGGTPAPGQPDPDALVASAARLDVDVLGVQEVDRCQPRSAGSDQTALVAAALGAQTWRFVPALHGTPGQGWRPAAADDGAATEGPTYGVGLVSRWPVRSWAVLRFPATRSSLPLLVPGRGLARVSDEPRVAVAAQVERPDGATVTVATCHLSFVPGANVRQLRAVCRWLRAMPPPRLLIGDLNVPGRLPAVVTGWRQLARVATYPSWRPRVQWDHALASGIAGEAVIEARAVRLPVSDHQALRVVVEL